MKRRMGLLVFDRVTMLDVSGPAEVLGKADAIAGDAGGYELVYVSPDGGNVATSSGMTIADTLAPADAGPLDTLLVAGAEHLATDRIDADLLATVDALAADAARVASVCTGAFALAELGWLDGRRATTHWRHADALARRYPAVRVEPDVIHIRDGRYLTSAGITAGIDLTLALVEEDLGADVARAAARDMVMFMQRPGGQSQFSSALDAPPGANRVLRELLAGVRADPAADHTVASMAAAANVSTRHLGRLFHDELGTTPARWVERIRLDRARQLILEGLPVTKVAELSGFGSDDTLRRSFGRHLHTTPTEYRARFASALP
ncbi:GlxA family transcriptional regulator [uncultured Corynebacterium sp.]|uniref:GlxA family transcriptional regulator n=1 Tax=uncultured Corynebacterium sp. TaxID=159447 RepID=UPI0025EBEAC8|nr:helix-turn-helix domain-containing protein [uncultured Corynebacterium sp.]